MPRTASVTTIDNGYHRYTFELNGNRFVGVSTDDVGHNPYSASRAQIRSIITKLDKYVAKNGYPQFDGDEVLPSIGEVATTHIDERVDGADVSRSTLSYTAYFNTLRGITIGCMDFDKAALNKMRKWANAETVAKTPTKAARKAA